MSDEANGSLKAGGGGAKSAFSETISNPDLDEIFFNKHPGGVNEGGTPLSKKIGLTELKL